MRLFPYLLLLILLSSAVAADISQPSAVSSVQLEITQNITLNTPLSVRVEKATIEFLMPQQDTNQKVLFLGDTKKDDLDNSLALLSLWNPPKSFSQSKTFLVNVSAIHMTSLPASYEIPDELKIYLRPSKGIQSNDSKIKALAASITNGSSTDFERVAALARWVHDNVVYDKQLKGETKDAVWVLENKIGVCDEISTLFIALARSIGIPARYVAGYYYGDEGWGEHAFAEVYLGKWVSVDPTNLDVGRLDATHIKFFVTRDNVAGNRITSNVDLSNYWGTDTSIKELNHTEDSGFNYSVSVSAQDLSPGDSAVVVLRLMPEEYAFLRVTLQPCISDFNFITLDREEKDAILEPGKESVLYWKIGVSENLKNNMLYTCPLVLNSKLLRQRDVTLNVKTAGKGEKPVLKAELSDVEVGLGQNETIFVSLQDLPESEQARVGVIADGYFKEFIVSGGQHLSVSFKPQHSGIREAVIYSSTGSALLLNYVVKEFTGVYIESIELPQIIQKGATGAARVFIKNDRPMRQDLKLYMDAGSSEVIRSLSLDDISLVELPFTFDSVGVNRLIFRVKGSDFDMGTVREVRVYDVPDVAVDAVYIPARRKAVVTLEASKDVARNVRVVMGEVTRSESELYGRMDIEFNASAAAPVTVFYEDQSGALYSINAVMRTQEEGIIEGIIRFFIELIRSL
jgi:hypothetical protein